MKHGNMRSYDSILTAKLAGEKCTTRASPCVRYFVNDEGKRVSSPEEFVAGKDAFITPTEYRKRVDNLKRDKSGKFAKLEATYKSVTEVDEGATIPREGTEQALGESKTDEGGIVSKAEEGESSRACFGTYENTPACHGCSDERVCQMVNPSEIINDSEPCESLNESNDVEYHCFGNYRDKSFACRMNVCKRKEECRVEANNPVEETKDDLGVLAEPEPAWSPEYASEPMIAKPVTIEQMWVHVSYCLGAIRNHEINRVDNDIQRQLKQILGGR